MMVMFFAITGIVAVAIIGSVAARFFGLGSHSPNVLPAELQIPAPPPNPVNSFQQYFDGDYNEQQLTIVGTMHSEVQWMRTAGIYRYYIADDTGLKIYLDKLIAAQLQLISFNTGKSFSVTGTFYNVFSEPKIDVKSLSLA
jgi:hypothetical protein